jgi:CheY-like chemotaxis protein
VRLPAAVAPPDARVEIGTPASAAASESPGRILIIEDEPAAARLLRTYLEASGYEIALALDGPTGLAAARHSAPAAIVLDVMLPGLDGWEVLRQLKLDLRTREVPVVMVTVVDEQEVGLALGAVDYLVKPIDPAVLTAVLARHIRIHHPRSPAEPIFALAIDDDPASLRIVETCLSQQDVVVSCADNGLDGLDLARRQHFDVILCDLLMPGVDGFAVIAALRENLTTRETPILVVTGQDLSDADKARLNGNILGIVSKGTALEHDLRGWLARLDRSPEPASVAEAGAS